MRASTTVTVAGVRSPVLCAGPQDAAEAVVFVHGNPGPASDWHDLLTRIGEHGRAVAPDMPGYGGADKPREFAYSVPGYAQHLDGVLRELGIARAHLVLHDYGGWWGTAWAAAHPDAVASVTLINTGVVLDYRWHHWARVWRTPVVGELFWATASRPAFRLLVGRENPRLDTPALDALHTAYRSWATRRAVLRLYRATPPALLAAPRASLRALDPPALVLWGTEDRYIPVAQAQRQRESLPSARIVELPGLGHWPMHEDPALVAGHVIPFLREQLSAAA